MVKISYYKNVKDTASTASMLFDKFVHDIVSGTWQDIVLAVRNNKFKKTDAPAVTVSGVFSERKANALSEHSNLIAIDIDKVSNIDEVVETLKKDTYTHFLFRSISGKGLCCVVKIEGKRHLEAFKGLSQYYFERYGLLIDQSCKDVSRSRFVSYDPDAFFNENSSIFKIYPKSKEIDEKKTDYIVHTDDDIAFVVSQIQKKNINICKDYHEWLAVGFALSQELGEAGRDYFRIISQVSAMYRPDSQAAKSEKIEAQYTNCLKAGGSGITIRTFFHLAKQAGCELQSEKTKELFRSAYFSKKNKQEKIKAIEQLAKEHNLPTDQAKKIIEQVYSNEVKPNENNTDLIISFLKKKHNIFYNIVNEQIYIDNEPADARTLNTLYMKCVSIGKISFDFFERILNSEIFHSQNPIEKYFNELLFKYPNETGHVEKLLNTIKCSDRYEKNWIKSVIGKWLIGLVGGAFGRPANFAIVLVSPKTRIGKTTFFRNLLPDTLKDYFAEVSLDNSNKKDDIVPLTRNLFCFIDEWHEISNKNAERLRWIITSDTFEIRKSHRKDEKKYKRYASIAGTSNITSIIVDDSFNRRVVPIEVDRIDLKLLAEIDRELLFAEIVKVWKSGYNYELSNEDVELLKQYQTLNAEANQERELLTAMFQPASDDNALLLTCSEIASMIDEVYKTKISVRKLGMELKKCGFECKLIRRNGFVNQVYKVKKLI